MDELTVSQLESIRPQVPRYLFRAWNNTPDTGIRISGGHIGGNTPKAITPLYFLNGGTRSSVYELDRYSLKRMTIGHLHGEKVPVTEFSSWAASLSFVLCDLASKSLRGAAVEWNDIYISIIDTKQLNNEIFYVPSLNFLAPGRYRYPHEFLAHGVIRGSAYKAMPFRLFYDHALTLPKQLRTPLVYGSRDVHPLQSLSIENARQVGELYGKDFALPMCLAIITRKHRDQFFFRFGVTQLDVVLAGIRGLPVPPKWCEDEAIELFTERVGKFGEVEQFMRLMKAVTEHHHQEEEKKRLKMLEDNAQATGKKRKRSETTSETDSEGERELHLESGPYENEVRSPLEALERELRELLASGTWM